ncbi:MAG: nitroreductase family protein [Lachnospiraceae bacterium]|nr:nitroreductase family protein [Lachnospiraceae bacterium]
MELKELIKANRSFRGYDEGRRVSREELLEMVDCARFTASSVNQQPLRYYLAYESDVVDRIHPLIGWARGLPNLKLPHEGMYPAAYIVICQDTRVWESTSRFTRDVGIVAQTILLSATEMGLGGCMIGNFSPEKISSALQLPEYMAPLLVVAVGKPAEKVVMVDIAADESTNYYRDENDTHYVPKRRLEDLVIN